MNQMNLIASRYIICKIFNRMIINLNRNNRKKKNNYK